jgi:3-hydroxyisobutyrate dehydrogenase-like beta-hydroxyacid dehydrogenase
MTGMFKVGFIGLGDQGEPMARHVVDAGWPLHIWARRAAGTEPFANTAVIVEDSPRALARRVEVLCLCTFGEEDLKDLLFREPDGIASGMAPGKVLIVHNTISPDACVEIGERLAGQGVAFLDAPVSGGREDAIAKRLSVIVGGDRAMFDRVRPILETYGDPVLHMGPIGSGQRAKIINNALVICNMMMASTAFDVAEKLGLDRQAAQDMLMNSSAYSRGMGYAVSHERGTRKVHASAADIFAKDVGLFVKLCATNDVDPGELGSVSAAAARQAREILHMD